MATDTIINTVETIKLNELHKMDNVGLAEYKYFTELPSPLPHRKPVREVFKIDMHPPFNVTKFGRRITEEGGGDFDTLEEAESFLLAHLKAKIEI